MSESDDSPTSAKVQKLSTSVLEISSDADCSLADVETQHALEDIDDCQKEIDILNEKASEEILQVEMKYNKLRRPHFQKRNELTQHIANFWVTVFLNHPQMANLIEEEEEECLHYLKQVDVEEFEDIKSGYCISFQFAHNPFFTNEILTKEYHLTSTDGKPVSRSAKIHWKANMNLLQQPQTLTKGPKRHRHRQRNSSFFAWFTENADPSRDRIAEMIKEDIWPNPLQYYLASDIEVEENGISEDDSDNDRIVEDDSVVIVGDDDDDDDDDVYEVEEDDDDNEDRHEETIESIEVEDDDDCDDDAVEVLGSDSEEDVSRDVAEISQDAEELPETNNISQIEEDVVDLEEATTLTKNHGVGDIHDEKDGNHHEDNNDLKDVDAETDSDLLRSAGEGGGKTVHVPDSSNGENVLKTSCAETGDSLLGVK